MLMYHMPELLPVSFISGLVTGLIQIILVFVIMPKTNKQMKYEREKKIIFSVSVVLKGIIRK